MSPSARSRGASSPRRPRLYGLLMLCAAIALMLAAGAATPAHGWVFACAILAAALFPSARRRLRRQRLRRHYRERLGGAGPFSCEVEIKSSGVTTNQAGTRITREWASILAVEDHGDSIEFVTKGAGTLIVRNRAFRSEQEWREFLEAARGYLTQARAEADSA